MGSLRYQGYTIRYDDYGEGSRALVLVHGLLLNRHMFDRIAPALAERGNRVVCIDLLGHGDSDQPDDLRLYSMPLFGRQVTAVLNHLELDTAVVGGTSLGANVALDLAVRDPDRVEGLFMEMPVLDNALAAVAAFFSPILLGLRAGRPAFELGSRVARLIPRTHNLIDLGIDVARRRPGPSVAVLEGLLLGPTAPHREERIGISKPALIVGHQRDPLHPFSDSGMLAEELTGAQLVEAGSLLEWRLKPKRLTAELARFVDEVWEGAGNGAGVPDERGGPRVAMGG
ncbi:MAG TPA: alpha/beta fold hydrolase [Solirubrobacterales bacterium]